MRMRKEEQMRLEGMEQAVRFLEANGGSIKALKEDIRRRGGQRDTDLGHEGHGKGVFGPCKG